MTIESPILGSPPVHEDRATGVRMHRFTVAEYHRMGEAGVFHEDDPIEMLGGRLFIKLDNGPPYEVPFGIPPADIAGNDVPPFPQRRFTVREYRRLLRSGALSPELKTELIEGWVVEKMVRDPIHDATLQYVADALQRRVGNDWKLRLQSAVQLDESTAEPDVAVVPGPLGRFRYEHPRPHEVGLLIEISNTTLPYDRGSKRRTYARNNVAHYWVLNVLAREIEVYLDPSGPTEAPAYRKQAVLGIDESVELILREKSFGFIPVNELIPPNE